MRRPIFAAIIILLPVSDVLADALPDIKPGLWQMSTMIEGQPEMKVKQCVDKSTMQDMLSGGQKVMGGKCSKPEFKQSGGKYTSNATCKMMGTTMIVSSVAEGDFNKEYTVSSSTKFDPPMMGKSSSASKSRAVWLGPCEDGMKPGDTIMPDGRKINVVEMMKQMPKVEIPQMGADGKGPSPEELQRMMESARKMQEQMNQGQ